MELKHFLISGTLKISKNTNIALKRRLISNPFVLYTYKIVVNFR